MSVQRGFLLIAVMVGLGLAKASERTALQLASYDVGRTMARAHDLENDTERLRTRVIRLQSPAQLVQIMRNQKLDMVAWSLVNRPIEQPEQPEGTAAAPIAANPPTSLASAQRISDE